MKAEVRRPASPGAESEENQGHAGFDIWLLWKRFREDSLLRWALIAVVALVVLVPSALALRTHFEERSNEKAWDLFTDTLKDVRAGSAMDDAAAAARDAIPKLEAIRDRVAGTAVEPLVLFELGNRYFAAGQPERANDIYTDVRNRFPHHPLVDPNSTTELTPRVLAALNDCAVEMKWRREHPGELKPEAELKAEKTPPASPSDGTSQGNKKTSGEDAQKPDDKQLPPGDSSTAPRKE